MRNLAILIFQTLDGVMQAPSIPEEDFSGGFRHGGWAKDCWNDVMEQVIKEAMSEQYDLLLGRNTYNLFASNFASAEPDNPVADKLNRAKKYVVTSDTDDLTWNNSFKLKGSNAAVEVAKIKEIDGPLLQVHGSWQLVQLLLKHNLVDELRLWTFPVVVGEGKRLFENDEISSKYKLIKFATCPSGAFMHFYQSLDRSAV
ncbi:dihydrofolate reductase family protein [Microbulbifer variabilis]|uniref:Dihydrofolate reductase family protein n=1 Tax=Microbulbifer variabilis TaxID=266805 RepID=A0ABY4VGB9_9GAMM|nr:dihydrofolate reductase family protein [Microbulbifer variabilis]USD23296.1 dihydrofolate reductase family protein [Microbulbifer variabilis]